MPLRSETDFQSAMTLLERGRGDGEIAQLTGIPRATVTAWRQGEGSRLHRARGQRQLDLEAEGPPGVLT